MKSKRWTLLDETEDRSQHICWLFKPELKEEIWLREDAKPTVRLSPSNLYD